MVRGVDQTGRAFDSIGGRIRKLENQQRLLHGKLKKNWEEGAKVQIQYLKNLQLLEGQFYRFIFAGAAFLAFTGMVVWGLSNVIAQSSLGQLYMEDFSRAWTRLSVSVSEAILEKWGPAFKDLIKWMNDLAVNETFQMIVGEAAIPIILTLGIISVEMLAVGLLGKFLMVLADWFAASGYVSTAVTITQLAGGLKMVVPVTIVLSLLILVALAGEEIRKKIMEQLGYTAEQIETMWDPLWYPKGYPAGFPRDPEAEGAWWGDFWEKFMKGLGEVPEFQLGTTGASRTRLGTIHEGEYIFNPQLPITAPLQMGVGRNGGPIIITINQHIDSVGVEADEERLAEKTAEYIGDKITELVG